MSSLFNLSRNTDPATSHEAARGLSADAWQVSKGERHMGVNQVLVTESKRKRAYYRKLKHDLTGKRFGMLLVGELTRNAKGVLGYACACDCGGTSFVGSSDLLQGKSKSCGCQQTAKISSLRGKDCGNYKHGMKATHIYKCWYAMKQRCHYEKHKTFAQYGGRGITVCERWRNSFEAFMEDMGMPPSERHTLDRFPNGEGNYEPGNVRWATPQEQATNRRTTLKITAFGETKTAIEWAKDPRCVVPRHVLRTRVSAGWDAVRAMTQKPRRDAKPYTIYDVPINERATR